MTLSIWRYSHLILAFASSIFLLLASVTGVILSIEPISNKLQPYRISNAEGLSLAETISAIDAQYEEVLSISQDKNGFVSATVIIDNQNESFYVNPETGEKLGDIIEKAPIYQFSTNLHRSLFLKTPGRLFIGLTSFLLFLIAISGIVLIAKRQGGITKFFSKIVRENYAQYNHVVYSRFVLIPIVIIAISGVYLSLLRFQIIEENQITHEIDFDNLQEDPTIDYTQFELFKNTPLSELREFEFPFSEFVEDYYLVRLKNKELLINQYTGDVISEKQYPFVTIISEWATVLHTGEGSILWSIVLGIGSMAIPFLMITGFIIFFKRPKTKIKNPYSKDKANFVILVGSESGTTLQYAEVLHNYLLSINEKSYLAVLDQYTTYKNMKHLVVMTATYGQGEAPSNAKKFKNLIHKHQQKAHFLYSVVGFGSTSYPNFCQFAYETNELLETLPQAKASFNEIFTVNDQSFESFNRWASLWGEKTNLELRLKKPTLYNTKKHTSSFVVLDKTEKASMVDSTFLLTLKNTNGAIADSGDLLSIVPSTEERERLYSIGKMERNVYTISVKRHDKGVCSTYLQGLEIGTNLTASIIENKDFHFPAKSKQTILIATGTGIGPFLGMIKNNVAKKGIHLYWGGRTEESFKLYKPIISSALENGSLTSFKPAYSRTQIEKTYVQNLIKKDAVYIAESLRKKGCVMICGSITMQKEVLKELQEICAKYLNKDLSFYQNRNQIKMDCY
ncbi:PepSY domain-containing protein [Aurantibacter crassamenti]|uniref:PepSY domain-containing protein n=1 Tax=Aurantibacter crassamenti TaxID=1837375 RepID=UPI001939B300|nr:PepSY domain-containing protein [Aurantibacter crassamenti]MBM1106624.1 PepSY domain-containing protein [Aurantibacter crassamenti]